MKKRKLNFRVFFCIFNFEKERRKNIKVSVCDKERWVEENEESFVVDVVFVVVENYGNIKSNFSREFFICLFPKTKHIKMGEEKNRERLLCWLIEFFAAAALLEDTITMIKKIDFCFLFYCFCFLCSSRTLTNWVLIGSIHVCLPSRVLGDGIFDNV